MQKTETKSFDAWTDFYSAAPAIGKWPLWPAEPLIRMMRGNYVPGIDKEYAGKKAIDVGFGSGNNLLLLGSLGMELYGVEVSENICEQTTEQLSHYGYKADLKAGSNRSIPYPDDSFDVLVSWNVIHYDNTEEHMQQAIAEYARVLKPGGRFFVSTVAPNNKILLGAKQLSAHQFEIGRTDDFRKGEVFFSFGSPENVQKFFGRSFKDVLVGRVTEDLFVDVLDWYMVTGRK
jgi:SAM-dependent methyltransferase